MDTCMLLSLPGEILVEILEYLTLKELISSELLCKKLRELIRTTPWKHVIVRLRNETNIEYVTNNYKFTKYNFSASDITDKIVSKLKNSHTLDLSYCYEITDTAVKELRNCHTLNLSHCDRITDDSVKYLKNCHTLNLSCCVEITDDGVKGLKKLSYTLSIQL